MKTFRGESTPVHDIVKAWRGVILSILHIGVGAYYFSASIAMLEESQANGSASSIRFMGAVTASKFPVCDTLEGRVSTSGHWNRFYYRQTGHLLII